MQGSSGLVSIGGGSTGSVSVIGSTLTRISAVRNVEYASTVLYSSDAGCSEGRQGLGKLAQRVITQGSSGGLVSVHSYGTSNVSVVNSNLTDVKTTVRTLRE